MLEHTHLCTRFRIEDGCLVQGAAKVKKTYNKTSETNQPVLNRHLCHTLFGESNVNSFIMLDCKAFEFSLNIVSVDEMNE